MVTQVFQIAYCFPFSEDVTTNVCQDFWCTVKHNHPSLLNEVRIHLQLQVIDCMKNFGQPSSFTTERYVDLVPAVSELWQLH